MFKTAALKLNEIPKHLLIKKWKILPKYAGGSLVAAMFVKLKEHPQ